MPTEEDIQVAIAALRALLKFPRGAKRSEAFHELVGLWAAPGEQGFTALLFERWGAVYGSHTLASIRATAKAVNVDDEEVLRVSEQLDTWADGDIPADPFADHPQFALDLKVATDPQRPGDKTTDVRIRARMDRLNDARQSFAVAAPPIAGADKSAAVVVKLETSVAAAVASAAIAKASKRSAELYTLLPVWFGTDRHFNADDDIHVQIESRRGEDHVTYGLAQVSIPKSHEEGEIERPAGRWNLFKDDTEYPNKHIVIHTVQVNAKEGWVADIAKEGATDGLLFIHGFNVSFEEALWRTAQLANDLKFPGQAFCFSWASVVKGIRGYGADAATIGWSVPHLRQFLETLCSDLELTNLHVIAHSMGNRALLDVLENWQQKDQGTRLRQIVLAAPDIDAGRFRQIGKVFNKFDQVTLYASKEDKAIKASRKLHIEPRAGDANPPIVMDALSTVDVTKAGEGLFDLAHSYYAEVKAVIHDLFYVINRGFKPIERAGLQLVEANGHYELK